MLVVKAPGDADEQHQREDHDHEAQAAAPPRAVRCRGVVRRGVVRRGVVRRRCVVTHRGGPARRERLDRSGLGRRDRADIRRGVPDVLKVRRRGALDRRPLRGAVRLAPGAGAGGTAVVASTAGWTAVGGGARVEDDRRGLVGRRLPAGLARVLEAQDDGGDVVRAAVLARLGDEPSGRVLGIVAAESLADVRGRHGAAQPVAAEEQDVAVLEVDLELVDAHLRPRCRARGSGRCGGGARRLPLR